MYAAAGGASIANRRKQKRLQLNKREGSGAQAAAARARSASAAATGRVPTAGQPGIPTLQLQLPAPAIAAPTYGFHSSHEHHRGRGRRRPVTAGQYDRKSSSSYHHHHHHHHHHNNNNSQNADHNRHRLLAPPPISPIVQFPISPPPLSLESPNSLYGNGGVAQQATITGKSNGYGNNNSPAAVAFPFPPPSFLDLRVSPSTSELQCGGQGPGKAAWQGCARPSPLPLSPASPQGSRGEGYKTKQCEAHRRWMKRNRIRDASYCYGSSGEEDDYEDYEDGVLGADGTFVGRVPGGRRRGGEVSAAVNTVLYAGLGTTALGLVISFVGTGEKGFLSPELRLVGPSLLCAGLLCCLLRVLLCLCLCRCCGECRWRPCRLARSAKKDSAKQPTGRSGKAADSAGKANSAAAAVAAASSTSGPGGSQSNKQQGLTATLLPYHPPSTSQRQQPPVPSSSSCSTAKSHKGHELLLSPAQLPE